MTSITLGVGIAIQPYVKMMYERCTKMIEQSIFTNAQSKMEQMDWDFAICSLDLLGSLVEVFGENTQTLINNSNLIQNLFECMNNNDPYLRQTSFALCGDLARNCFSVFQLNVLEKFLPVLSNNVNYTDQSVCNNAVWALCEISLKIGNSVSPILLNVLPKIVLFLDDDNLEDFVLENLASSIGRFGISCPDLVSQSMDKWIKNFCIFVVRMQHHSEKDEAFRGFCSMVFKNPKVVIENFKYFCDAVDSVQDLSQKTEQIVGQTLSWLKQNLGNNWAQCWSNVPDYLKIRLSKRFNI